MTFNQSQQKAIKNVLSLLKVKLENSEISRADKDIVRELIEEVATYTQKTIKVKSQPPQTDGMTADEYLKYRTFT